MKTLALTNPSQFLLPKMGILTHLVELTRYDYIYIKDRIRVNDVLSIEIDHGRHWQKNALAVFHKEFKLGYLNASISKVVFKLVQRYGEVNVIIKNLPQSSNPFDGMDVLIQID